LPRFALKSGAHISSYKNGSDFKTFFFGIFAEAANSWASLALKSGAHISTVLKSENECDNITRSTRNHKLKSEILRFARPKSFKS
jgi:hypothetical protein